MVPQQALDLLYERIERVFAAPVGVKERALAHALIELVESDPSAYDAGIHWMINTGIPKLKNGVRGWGKTVLNEAWAMIQTRDLPLFNNGPSGFVEALAGFYGRPSEAESVPVRRNQTPRVKPREKQPRQTKPDRNRK